MTYDKSKLILGIFRNLGYQPKAEIVSNISKYYSFKFTIRT